VSPRVRKSPAAGCTGTVSLMKSVQREGRTQEGKVALQPTLAVGPESGMSRSGFHEVGRRNPRKCCVDLVSPGLRRLFKSWVSIHKPLIYNALRGPQGVAHLSGLHWRRAESSPEERAQGEG